MLDEVENADNGAGPNSVAAVDDPVLARIAVAQIRARSAERALDEVVMAAREADLSWQAIGNVLGMTRQRISRRLHTT